MIKRKISYRKCKTTPDVGLEPTTVGLKVQRSTDWANRALQASGFFTYIFIIINFS